MCEKEGKFSKIFEMFVWASGFRNPTLILICLWMIANKSPDYIREDLVELLIL